MKYGGIVPSPMGICVCACLSVCVSQGGNDFSEDPAQFDDLQYVEKPALLVLVRVEEPKIVFDPPLNDVQDIIHSCFNEIIDGAKRLLRVSTVPCRRQVPS